MRWKEGAPPWPLSLTTETVCPMLKDWPGDKGWYRESRRRGAPQWPLSARRVKGVPDTPRIRSWRKILGKGARSWRGQFELGNTWCTNKLSIAEAFTGWNPAEGGYGRLHLCPMCIFFHTTDHRILGFLYMFTLASVADPRLFDPRVCDDKTYITTLGMQQTFAHGRTT